MVLWAIPCFAGSVVAIMLAILLRWRKTRGKGREELALVMVTVGWIYFFNGMGLYDEATTIVWRQLTLVGELALPVTLYHIGLSFTEQLSQRVEPRRRWRFRVIGMFALGLGIVVLGFPDSVITSDSSGKEIVFTPSAGRLVWCGILITLILGLAEFERILRGVADPLRYQLKFVLIGLGGFAGFEIVQSSQLLFYPMWKPEYALVGSIAAMLSTGLIAFGLGRWHMQDLGQRLSLSPQVLSVSFTFVFVGFYLIAAGVLAEGIKQTGWARRDALVMLLLFVAGVGLVVVLSSRQVRAELRVYISRHFYRSKFDYRLKWLELAEKFSTSHSTDSILDQFLHILSGTFGAAKVSIWLEYEADKQFHQVRSINTAPPPDPLQATHPIVMMLKEKGEPVQLPENPDGTRHTLDAFQLATQAVVCVPLQVSPGQVMGFVTLSQDLQGRNYDKDDFDLLRAMAHHVAMLLAQVNLMEERTSAAKWEAVHRVSTFYMHDLKNLASGLSLVVQNAEVYGQDQDFQASAMRTVGSTAQRMLALISKLSARSKIPGDEFPQSLQRADVNALIRETLESLNGKSCESRFIAGSGLPCVSVLPEQFKQVVLNVILNAQQAMKERGVIEIKTERDGELVMVSVKDDGMGIPSSQLRSLFQPFRTTKKGGLGVGLYECKKIIEQYKGSIQVNSQEGKGTQVLIRLPAWSETS